MPNNYPNANFVPGRTSPTLLNTTTLTYVRIPDQSSARRSAARQILEQTIRLSYQMDSKNKFGIYYNNKKRTNLNNTTTMAQESRNEGYFFPFSDNLVQWSAPQTNRLLLEAGFWRHQETWAATGRQRHHGPVAVASRTINRRRCPGLHAVHPELPRARWRH